MLILLNVVIQAWKWVEHIPMLIVLDSGKVRRCRARLSFLHFLSDTLIVRNSLLA